MSSESVRINKDIIERVEQVLQAAHDENVDFNEALNGFDLITIPTLDPAPDAKPHKLEPSAVLFWTDRDAYNNEFSYWENASTQEIHRDAKDLIFANGQVPVFSELVFAMSRGRLVPFVGAGMSQPCNLPLWSTALQEIAKKVGKSDQKAFTTAIDKRDYIEAAQILWDADEAQVKSYIRNRFDKSVCTPDKIKGAALLLKRICSGCVITTNFDNVIESVCGLFEGYMHGVQAGNKFVSKLMKGDRCILKLHGDAEAAESYIFTGKQYLDGYGSPLDFSKPLPRALRQIFISQSLLFLGCSLDQDKTLELFQQVRDDGRKQGAHFEIPDHFAILPKPKAKSKETSKESQLSALGIRPLWYPEGKHQYVEKVLNLVIATVDGRIKPF